MFDGGNPDLGLRIERLGEMMHHRVVRLRRAAGPDDVISVAAEKMRQLFARLAQGDACLRADLMRAGRIAGKILRRIQPGLTGFAHDGRGRVVIEINHRPDKIQSAA